MGGIRDRKKIGLRRRACKTNNGIIKVHARKRVNKYKNLVTVFFLFSPRLGERGAVEESLYEKFRT